MMDHTSAKFNNRTRRRLCLAGVVLSSSLSSSTAGHATPSESYMRTNAKAKTNQLLRRNLQVEKHVLGKGLITFFDEPTSANPTMPGGPRSCQISSESSAYVHPNDSSTPTMAMEVPFVYEVETNTELTPGQMNVFVLPKVEQVLGNELLPVLFDECAVGDGGGDDAMTRYLALDESNPLTDGSIVGMTTSPRDLAVSSDDGAVCTAIQTSLGNSCTVVEGFVTVYVPMDSALASFGEDSVEKEALMDEIVSSVQDAIRETMESGSLNGGGADESVQRVAYSRDGSYRKSPVVALGTDGENENTTSGGVDGDFPIYAIVIISLVAVGAVVLIVGTKVHNHRKNEEGDYESDDSGDEEEEEDDDEEHPDVSGFHDNPTEVAERGGKSMYDMNPVAEDDLSAIL